METNSLMTVSGFAKIKGITSAWVYILGKRGELEKKYGVEIIDIQGKKLIQPISDEKKQG